MGAALLAGVVGFATQEGRRQDRTRRLRYALWGVMLATVGYVVWIVGWLDAFGPLQQLPRMWQAPVVSFLFGLLSLISLSWEGRG